MSMPGKKAAVLLRRNEDGLTRRYEFNLGAGDDDRAGLKWSEGEYACDCHRGMLFAAAEDEEMAGHVCGNTIFSVRVEDESGSLLYQDMSWLAS